MSTFCGFLCIAAVSFILFVAILACACLMFGNKNEEDEA
jgi:hypothetical protein